MARKSLGKVLIIQTAFLGDVILATGLVEKIHTHFPESSIDFLLRKGNESLLNDHPHINEVLILDKKKKYSHLLKLIKNIRANTYDLVVNVQRHLTTGLITAFSGANLKTGFRSNPLSFAFTNEIKHDFEGDHEIERNHRLIEWLTDDQPARPKLYPGKENFEKIESLGNKGQYICITPASIWFTKQFPEVRWVELISKLPDRVRIYLLGSKSDYNLCERIEKQIENKDLVNLCGKLDLLDSAALMKKAVINLVNDSAPMHIASAMNAPTCAIYCSTIPQFGYGPLSDNSIILQITDEMTCRPCGIHGKVACPEKHFNCAYQIDLQPLLTYWESISKT
jgi:heptosyltransferase-2